MNSNEEYYMLLSMQYQKSLGMTPLRACYNIGSSNFQKELMEWLKERRRMGEIYKKFLNYYAKNISTLTTAEINKGNLDSIVYPSSTTIITQYNNFDKEKYSNNIIIKSDFFPDAKRPGLIRLNNSGKIESVKKAPNFIEQYITENPYRRTDISGFEELHNGNNFDIIVGMYGHIHDNDKEDKLKQLKNLREKITNDDIKVVYDCLGNSYYAAVMSDRKIKKLHCKVR